MTNVNIQILDKRVVWILRKLEALKLLKIREDQDSNREGMEELLRLKGAMKSESEASIERKFRELRDSWE